MMKIVLCFESGKNNIHNNNKHHNNALINEKYKNKV